MTTDLPTPTPAQAADHHPGQPCDRLCQIRTVDGVVVSESHYDIATPPEPVAWVCTPPASDVNSATYVTLAGEIARGLAAQGWYADPLVFERARADSVSAAVQAERERVVGLVRNHAPLLRQTDVDCSCGWEVQWVDHAPVGRYTDHLADLIKRTPDE